MSIIDRGDKRHRRLNAVRAKLAAGRIATLDSFRPGDKVTWNKRRGEIIDLQGEGAAVVASDGRRYLVALRDLERGSNR